jgi:hypothetical protein
MPGNENSNIQVPTTPYHNCMRRNIDQTRRELEDRPETEQVQLDGDSSEVIIRAMVDDVTDEFESAVDALPCEIKRTKFVGFGVEVVLE